MKNNTLLVCVVAALVAAGVWYLHKNPPVKPSSAVVENAEETNNLRQDNNAIQQSTQSIVNVAPIARLSQTSTEEQTKRIQFAQKVSDEWRTPIEFYGVVEDESNNVIADANVDFECNDASAEGTSFYKTVSGTDGRFSITEISGKMLRASVTKEGYYPYDAHGKFFYYAGQNQNFVPDENHPVVFRLRKKGEGARLVHYDKSFRLPRDGMPVSIDLTTGKVSASEDNALRLECWTLDKAENNKQKYDWGCRISVPGGGLQIYDQQFPFVAPTAGYVSENLINMAITNAQWSYIVQRNFFIKTAAGNYGRMVFKMVAGGDNFAEVNLYLNSSGSPNLESN